MKFNHGDLNTFSKPKCTLYHIAAKASQPLQYRSHLSFLTIIFLETLSPISASPSPSSPSNLSPCQDIRSLRQLPSSAPHLRKKVPSRRNHTQHLSSHTTQPHTSRIPTAPFTAHLAIPNSYDTMAFPGGPAALPGMNPNAGMSAQEQQMVKYVRMERPQGGQFVVRGMFAWGLGWRFGLV